MAQVLYYETIMWDHSSKILSRTKEQHDALHILAYLFFFSRRQNNLINTDNGHKVRTNALVLAQKGDEAGEGCKEPVLWGVAEATGIV